MADLESPATLRNGSGLPRVQIALRVLLVLGILFVFLCGVCGLGSGFKGLGKDWLDSFLRATGSPVNGLMIGILATTLVQSSSATTSMIVGMVASGTLPVHSAVPMVMGANIGTTVTNTIVSLGHMGRPEEFRRAFAAATCHDFFNFITVAVMLPIEVATGFLEKTAGELSIMLAGAEGGKFPNPIKDATKAAIKPVKEVIAEVTDSSRAQAVTLIIFSMIVIFATLYLLVKVLRASTASKMEGIVSRALGKSAYLGIIVGVAVTVMVQSSSITTSVMVPLAGAGVIALEAVFPITVGANIGTTVTALIASLAAPPETLHLGLQIALVHLLFNLCGTIIVFAPPPVRKIPIRLARWIADVAVDSRRYALVYVLGLFYGLPAALVFIARAF